MKFLVFGTLFLITASEDVFIDWKGYIAYCPCMGRFGNQADQFLGALAFAHYLDRTLILPPWVVHPENKPSSGHVPFDEFFNVAAVNKYHRAITMELFMDKFASKVWPPERRTVFCWTARHGPEPNDCNAKDGNPFGPFWNRFNIDFVGSEFYGQEGLDFYLDSNPAMVTKWKKKYPPKSFPVLAFTGPPAGFPVKFAHVGLHRYLVWSGQVQSKVQQFISKHNLDSGPWLGVHFRNGPDWDNVCQHIDKASHLFASPQCLGYDHEHGELTHELCLPSLPSVIKQIRLTASLYKPTAIVIASDWDFMLEDIAKTFSKLKVLKSSGESPQLDLAIMAEATHYTGNCISSFHAFVKRDRDQRSLPTDFWNFQVDKIRLYTSPSMKKTEL